MFNYKTHATRMRPRVGWAWVRMKDSRVVHRQPSKMLPGNGHRQRALRQFDWVDTNKDSGGSAWGWWRYGPLVWQPAPTLGWAVEVDPSSGPGEAQEKAGTELCKRFTRCLPTAQKLLGRWQISECWLTLYTIF